MGKGRFLLLGGLSILLASCHTTPQQTPLPFTKPSLEPVSYSEIPGWEQDQHSDTLAAFKKSCDRILKSPADKNFGLGLVYGDWQKPCRDLSKISSGSARSFFETSLTPYLVKQAGRPDGLFTGYYEASLQGSYDRKGPYQTPLRLRPTDLVMVNLEEFRDELKGQRIAGRVTDGYLKPYESRAEIEQGDLPDAVDKPILWVDSAVDAFFLQVQGSGIVTLPDGQTVRVGYDGQNGHPYKAIGKELINRGALTKDNVSMQSIRDWLAKNPADATELMQINPSYVFFKKLETDGSVGGEGVVLTAGRSMAVDRSLWPYGIPMFVSADDPEGRKDYRFERLLIAQDTGGAIIGSIRGDVFWGHGDQAAHISGLMKSKGQLWVLLPKGTAPSF